MKKKISLIFPTYCEEKTLPFFFERLDKVKGKLEAKGKSFELIFVDDGSTDQTSEILKDRAKANREIKIIRFVRNFGSQVAIKTGLDLASGECAVVMSVDLQEPPELLEELIDLWETGGHPLVIGTRKKIIGSFFRRLSSTLFYRILNHIGSVQYPPQGADVVLLDRRVLDQLKLLGEHNISIVGLILWLGYQPKIAVYERAERQRGHSGWALRKRINVFMDTVVAFSYYPVRVFAVLGIGMICLSVIYGGILIFNRFYWAGSEVPGWTAGILLFLFFQGCLILGLGILGEYVWRILDETRKRPVALIGEKVNFD